MYNDKFRILEFGMSSGNNAEFVVKNISQRTSNFEYIGLEHESSYNQSMDMVFKKLAKLNVKNFELKPNTFESFKSLDNKADLIIASHCLSFCKPDKFYSFMQNITHSVKNGGVFMGELYLDKMGPRFMLNEESAFNLLSGQVDKNGNLVSDKNLSSAIFNGFNVDAQLSKSGSLVHFVATKTNCKGALLNVRDNLVDYSNPKVAESAKRYDDIKRSAEAQENRGDWVNYASIYSSVNMPRPLVQSFFDSAQGVEFLNTQINSNNMGLQSENLAKDAQQIQNDQNTEVENFENNQAQQDSTTETTQLEQEYENPDAWSVHFNQDTQKLPKGNPNGVANKDLKESQKFEQSSLSEETQNDVPVQ